MNRMKKRDLDENIKPRWYDPERERPRYKSGSFTRVIEAEAAVGQVIKIDVEPDEDWAFGQVDEVHTTCEFDYFRQVFLIPEDGSVVTGDHETWTKSWSTPIDGKIYEDSSDGEYYHTHIGFDSDWDLEELDGKICYHIGTEFKVSWRYLEEDWTNESITYNQRYEH